MKKKSSTTSSSGKEPYDWITPVRPATDEETEQMFEECENSPTLSLEEARTLGYELLAKWRKERK